MAVPQIVTVRDFGTSRYADLGEDLPIGDIIARAESAVQSRLGRTIPVTTYVETFRAQ